MSGEVAGVSERTEGYRSLPGMQSGSPAGSIAAKSDAACYAGCPAVGASKAASAAGIPTLGPKDTRLNQQPRRLVWTCVAGFLASWFIKFVRFFLPTPDRLFVIYARCTHLGCTPDWKPAEDKFNCPCHGSGCDNEGINFEGPAPGPMDRARLAMAPGGQIVMDMARLHSWPKGQGDRFNDPGGYLSA